MSIELDQFVTDFALGLKQADSRQPIAINVRSKEAYRPGIGPHPESKTVELVAKELELLKPQTYDCRIGIGIPYPDIVRQKCDLCLGNNPNWEWTIEIKMLRILGDNGKPNDNILMHILSPYPAHRSALTDCKKLIESGFASRKAILIYGYESDDWPIDTAIDAFEKLAKSEVTLSHRFVSDFNQLIHPVHKEGKIYAWEIKDV